MTLDTVGDVKRALRAKTTRRVLVHVAISDHDRPGANISKAAGLRFMAGLDDSTPTPLARWLDDDQTLLDIGGFQH